MTQRLLPGLTLSAAQKTLPPVLKIEIDYGVPSRKARDETFR
jgi:hypothetical protein